MRRPRSIVVLLVFLGFVAVLCFPFLAIAQDGAVAAGLLDTPMTGREWMELGCNGVGNLVIPASVMGAVAALLRHVPKVCDILARGLTLAEKVFDWMQKEGGVPIRIEMVKEPRRREDDDTPEARTRR